MGILSDTLTARDVFWIIWGIIALIRLGGIRQDLGILLSILPQSLSDIKTELSSLQSYVSSANAAAIDSSQTLKSINSTLHVMRNNR